MNLHGIVSGAIASVNPRTRLTLQRSTGYTTAADGSRAPSYDAPVDCYGQVQELSTADLRQIDGLNIQGTRRVIYLDGKWEGVVRADGKGGDRVTLPDASVWLVVHVLEHWRHWSKIVVVLQNGA